MAQLWFQNHNGEEKVIAECTNFEEVYAAIDKFIQECNEKYRKKKPFVSYYTRMWNENGCTIFDVGSHTEFFKFDLPYTPEEK